MFIKYMRFPIAVLFSTLCVVGFASAGPSKSFKQWDVYCSDVLDCRFSNWVDSEVINSLEFLRDGKADAPVEIRMFTQKPLQETAGLKFSIPGILSEFVLRFSDAANVDGYMQFSDPRVLTKLLPAMRKGEKMLVSLETAEPSPAVEYSLSGVSAAMLYLDDIQNRLNKTDALVETGTLPATGVVNRAVELKSSSELPLVVAQAWKDHPDECSEDYGDGDLIKRFGGIAIGWDDEKSVKHYIIPCGGPGAYNLVYAAFLFDEETGSARNLQFPTMSEKGPSIVGTIINMSWDDNASQLSQFAKGRGLGDCGTASTWEWDGNAFYGNFVLVAERFQDECNGNYDDWPVVWPVK